MGLAWSFELALISAQTIPMRSELTKIASDRPSNLISRIVALIRGKDLHANLLPETQFLDSY